MKGRAMINFFPKKKRFVVTIFGMTSLAVMMLNSCGNVNDTRKHTRNCPLGTYYGVAVGNDSKRSDIDAIGATKIHIWIHWDYTEPVIKVPLLSMNDVTEELIEQYSSGNYKGIDWSLTDSLLNLYEGLTLVAGVGSGWKVDMPFYQDKKIAPEAIGEEKYLAHLYLFTRSCVRRYGDKIVGWQIENEPNVAAETETVGIRTGDAWHDKDFVTKVLQILKKAIQEEDPEAWVTINFHTDIHYEKDIQEWLPLVDVVSIDAYPNYFSGNPVNSKVVLDRVKKAKALAGEKPVIVMETGYATAPKELGYSEKKQSIYIEEVFTGIAEAGGCGVFYFKLTSAEENRNKLIPQENYWGLIRKDGSPKTGWHTLKKMIERR
ncbi:MAG: beta-galactosidase [Bacteroidota bacterium]